MGVIFPASFYRSHTTCSHSIWLYFKTAASISKLTGPIRWHSTSSHLLPSYNLVHTDVFLKGWLALRCAGTAINNPYVTHFLCLPAIAWHPFVLFDLKLFGLEILPVGLIQHSLVFRVVVLQTTMNAVSVLLFLQSKDDLYSFDGFCRIYWGLMESTLNNLFI